jgi:hypothetical protein
MFASEHSEAKIYIINTDVIFIKIIKKYIMIKY